MRPTDRARAHRRTTLGASVVIVAMLATGAMVSGCRGDTTPQVTASDVVEQSFDLAMYSAPPSVMVTTFNGGVTIRAGSSDRAAARVTRHASAPSDSEAKELLGQVTVTFDQQGPRVIVTVKRSTEPTGPKSNGADVEITVPSAASVEVHTSNGAVDVSGIESTARVETSNARVSLSGGLQGAEVESSNGEIVVDGATGNLRLETSNAAIRVTSADAIVDAETSNGAITYGGSLATGSHRFETSNAAITLTLPADAAFTVDARTSSGKATSDFPVPDGSPDDDAVLTGALPGDDGVRITAETSNGDIRIVPEK